MASHTDEWLDVDDPADRGRVVRRRASYGICSGVLALLVLGAVVEAAGAPVYGVHTSTTTATDGGWTLAVRHGDRSRPGLATPFDIEVTRAGGFDGPVTVAVSSDYLAMWDENGLDPQPSEETADASRTIWTFEPPDGGDTLSISFDARIEPANQSSRSGRVEIVDGGAPVVGVDIRTVVLP